MNGLLPGLYQTWWHAEEPFSQPFDSAVLEQGCICKLQDSSSRGMELETICGRGVVSGLLQWRGGTVCSRGNAGRPEGTGKREIGTDVRSSLLVSRIGKKRGVWCRKELQSGFPVEQKVLKQWETLCFQNKGATIDTRMLCGSWTVHTIVLKYSSYSLCS